MIQPRTMLKVADVAARDRFAPLTPLLETLRFQYFHYGKTPSFPDPFLLSATFDSIYYYFLNKIKFILKIK